MEVWEMEWDIADLGDTGDLGNLGDVCNLRYIWDLVNCYKIEYCKVSF